jgi:hypothetical protein
MTSLRGLSIGVVALLLGACAHLDNTVGSCVGKSTCPVIIYEKFPNVFATFPEKIHIESDLPANMPTLLFTFADQSRYRFQIKSSSPKGDGIELIGASGSVLGIGPCVITNDSSLPVNYTDEGPYLRCQVRNGANFGEVRYRVRFHTVDGVEKLVDPVVDSSGSGDLTRKRAAVQPPTYKTLKVNVGDAVHLPPLEPDTAVKVFWDAGANALFKTADKAFVRISDASGVIDYTCFISADGITLEAESRYYFCLIPTPGNFSYTYDATYRDAGGLQSVTRIPFTRP